MDRVTRQLVQRTAPDAVGDFATRTRRDRGPYTPAARTLHVCLAFSYESASLYHCPTTGIPDGYYIEEVDPITLQPFHPSLTRDGNNAWCQTVAYVVDNWRPVTNGTPILVARTLVNGDWKCWAVLTDDSLGVFQLSASVDGGLAGDSSTQCSWTYTLRDAAGTEIATARSPVNVRPEYGRVVQPANNSVVLCWIAGGDIAFFHPGETPGVRRDCGE